MSEGRFRGRHALILGGSGQLGRAVAEALLGNDWRVTSAQRQPDKLPDHLIRKGLQAVSVNLSDRASFGELAAGAFDAVIDTICYSAKDADRLMLIGKNAAHLVAISSASVYCDHRGLTLDEGLKRGYPVCEGPIQESQSTVDPGPQTYSTLKIAMERRLLDRADAHVTILRPAAIHGIGSRHPREWWFVKRALDGRRQVPLSFQGESRFHTASAVGIAKLIVQALEHPGTRVFNIADPDAPTVTDIGRTIRAILNHEWELIPLEGAPGRDLVGATPWSIPSPITLDLSASASIGYRPILSYAESVEPYCRWLIETAKTRPWREAFPVMAGYPWDPFDYDAEDTRLSGL